MNIDPALAVRLAAIERRATLLLWLGVTTLGVSLLAVVITLLATIGGLGQHWATV